MENAWETICFANCISFLFLDYYPNPLLLLSASFFFNSVCQFLLALKINKPRLMSGINTLLHR